jgi:hypothetical protein
MRKNVSEIENSAAWFWSTNGYASGKNYNIYPITLRKRTYVAEICWFFAHKNPISYGD